MNKQDIKSAAKAFEKKLLDLHDDTFQIVTRILVAVIAVIVVGFAFSAYISHVKIDEGTDALYRKLDVVFYVFCGLIFVAAGLAALLIVYAVKRRKIFYSFYRKSKLNRRIFAFDVILFIGMLLFCLLCIYPIIYVLAGSFNQGADYAIGGVWFLPRVFTFENYKAVLKDGALWHSYLVTIGRTTLGTVTALVFTAAVGYAMSRPNLKFKKFFYWVNILTMFFGGGLIPYFLIIRGIGLFNTFWVYIIPGLYSVYNMIVIQSGFKAIDSEIHDAAVVDGAGELRIWWTIYMPLAKPVLATIALWLAVGHWNSYFDTMIYTNSDNLHTLQYYLLQAIQTSSLTEGMTPEMMERMSAKTLSLAAIIISIVPVFCFFPLIRKNFSTGIMVGSLKG